MMVVPVKLELLEPLANLANNPLLLANNNKLLHASLAPLELPAHLDLPDLLVMLDQMATLDPMVAQLPLVSLDQKDLLDLPAQMDNLVLPVTQVLPLNPKVLPLALLDLLVMLEPLAHLDLPAVLETMVLPVNLDPKDLPAPTETLDPMDNLVLPDKLAQLVVQEKKVSAPNIAPSMVVSSSKTELAVKHLQSKSCSVASDAFFSFNCNAHCHCCHASWLCKILDRTRWFYLFFVILSCANYLDKNKKIL